MTGKGTEAVGQLNIECCMCGDLGFSDQLFQCKVCKFRSQHRYCSNFYPKAESLGTCNWCLSQQKEDTKEKSPNSSNSSSPHKNNNAIAYDDESKNKRITRRGHGGSGSSSGLQPIKKQKSPEAIRSSPQSSSPSPSPSPRPSPSVVTSTRKRIITNGALEERLRRTRSEDIANRTSGAASATRQVFRNRVRRYKLLDEVSS